MYNPYPIGILTPHTLRRREENDNGIGVLHSAREHPECTLICIVHMQFGHCGLHGCELADLASNLFGRLPHKQNLRQLVLTANAKVSGAIRTTELRPLGGSIVECVSHKRMTVAIAMRVRAHHIRHVLIGVRFHCNQPQFRPSAMPTAANASGKQIIRTMIQ